MAKGTFLELVGFLGVYFVAVILTTGCSQGGGGGGGNNPPSCTINLQSPITYDGMEYVDKTTGQTKRKQPSTIQGRIRTRDPDGDRMRITKLTVSKPECLKVTRNGKTLYTTPQGKITGKTPTLDGANYCDVRIRVQVSDGRGGTNIRPSAVRRPLSADSGPAPGQTE